MSRASHVAQLVRRFAQPLDLSCIDKITQPTAFAVDIAGLADAIYERKDIRLVRRQVKSYSTLTKLEIEAVLSELGKTYEISGRGPLRELRDAAAAQMGTIALNKSGVVLRSLETPLTVNVEVEKAAVAVGHDPDRVSLRGYINAHRLFILLFSTLEFAYINGSLFRTDSFIDRGASLLRRLLPDPMLEAVTDEKGVLTSEHAKFDEESCFGVVVSRISKGDDVLVCDDNAGDVWTNFLGISNAGNSPQITFYFAKHGPLSLEAGPLYPAIRQALQNLRRMSLPVDAVRRKIPVWRRNYITSSGLQTAIPRIVRGKRKQLPVRFELARSTPGAVRRAMIVTSSLSYSAVEQSLADIAAGQRPNPHFVQLYWLLQSYFSGCSDVSASGFVVCQP